MPDSFRFLRSLPEDGTLWELTDSGRLLASSSNELRVWDALAVRRETPIRSPTGSIRAAAFTHDARFVLSAAAEAEASGEVAVAQAINFVSPVRLISEDLRANDRRLRLWSVESSSCLRVFPEQSVEIRSISIVPGTEFFVAGDAVGNVSLWNLASGSEEARVNVGPLASRFSVFPDRERILVGYTNGALEIRDLRREGRVTTLQSQGAPISALALDDAGHLVASAAFDGLVSVWDTATGECVLRFTEAAGIFQLLLRPDGRALVSMDLRKTLRMWSVPQGRCMLALHRASGVVLSPRWELGIIREPRGALLCRFDEEARRLGRSSDRGPRNIQLGEGGGDGKASHGAVFGPVELEKARRQLHLLREARGADSWVVAAGSQAALFVVPMILALVLRDPRGAPVVWSGVVASVVVGLFAAATAVRLRVKARALRRALLEVAERDGNYYCCPCGRPYARRYWGHYLLAAGLFPLGLLALFHRLRACRDCGHPYPAPLLPLMS